MPKLLQHDRLKTAYAFLPGVLIGTLYGVLSRLLFDMPNSIWLTMTCAFLLVAPFVVGYLTVWLAPPALQAAKKYAIFAPWLTCLLLFITVWFFKLEFVICILMASPLFLLLASVGGFIGYRVLRNRQMPPSTKTSLTALFLFLPYLAAPLESTLPTPVSIRQVDTEIVINAPVAIVWANIKSVPTIQPSEQTFNLLHWVGMPKPVAATLSHDGVGGVRDATFDNGLTFVETVTAWQQNQHIAFSIRPTGVASLQPWNQIGGPYFDILDGAYTVEPLTDGRVLLHLYSRHRLSTHFNLYGGLWTDYIMRDLQNYILRVIKARCEKQV